MNYTQDQKDEPLTVTLKASDWRLVCYAVEHMVEQRGMLFHRESEQMYNDVRFALYEKLNIESSGNLPVDQGRYFK